MSDHSLITAAKAGDAREVQSLLKDGAPLHDQALLWAAKLGHLEVVKVLIANGIDITLQNGRAMHLAIEGEHIPVIAEFMKYGVWTREIVFGCIAENNRIRPKLFDYWHDKKNKDQTRS